MALVACSVSTCSSHYVRTSGCASIDCTYHQQNKLTLRFSSSYPSIASFNPATSSSLLNNISLKRSDSAVFNHHVLVYDGMTGALETYRLRPVTSSAAYRGFHEQCSIVAADVAFPTRATDMHDSLARRSTKYPGSKLEPTGDDATLTVQICVPNCASRVRPSFSSRFLAANSLLTPSSASCRSAICASVSAL